MDIVQNCQKKVLKRFLELLFFYRSQISTHTLTTETNYYHPVRKSTYVSRFIIFLSLNCFFLFYRSVTKHTKPNQTTIDMKHKNTTHNHISINYWYISIWKCHIYGDHVLNSFYILYFDVSLLLLLIRATVVVVVVGGKSRRKRAQLNH